jgi:hypothetical protein
MRIGRIWLGNGEWVARPERYGKYGKAGKVSRPSELVSGAGNFIREIALGALLKGGNGL